MKKDIAEAKAQFAEFIRRAEAEENIELTRYGLVLASADKVMRCAMMWNCLVDRSAIPALLIPNVMFAN